MGIFREYSPYKIINFETGIGMKVNMNNVFGIGNDKACGWPLPDHH